MNELSCSDVLEAGGVLSRYLTGFIPRAAQLQMASAIERTLMEQRSLIVEAGTGTGKTFAYLVPALLSDQKIIISTGTKNLQDQLFRHDLPLIRKALNIPIKVALLKGRSNYLCRYRLQHAYQDGRFTSRQAVYDLQRIQQWSIKTADGDISTIENVSDASPVWSSVTSTADNCLGQECDFFADCFLAKARKAAQEADIVVVNHHLFFADMALREEGFGEVLPSAHAVIFDEAHQLPEVASQYFGMRLSSRQLLELARDVEIEYVRSVPDMSSLQEVAVELQQAVQEMRLALGREKQREPWSKIAAKPALKRAIEKIKQYLENLTRQLALAAERSKGLENCARRSAGMEALFKQLTALAPDNCIHWYETYTQAFTLNHTPLNIAEQFRLARDAMPRAWIFTSATLAIGNSFEHFQAELGLTGADCLQLESPFNYAQQTLLYLPLDLPDPQHQHYLQKLIEKAVPVIEASRGRTFFLFTSHRALLQAAELLSVMMRYPILVQGSMPKMRLLERYKELGNAVLLGTSSFWEGVDVRGEALSCVIIDKLPFSVPDDPLTKARMQTLRHQNKDPFNEYQLPQAVITLKQGAGRLIRDPADKGTLMLCDPRLLTRHYGRVFLDSLPAMPVTTELAEVEKFYEDISN